MDEIVDMIRSNVKPQNFKVGWFKTYENCVPGSEIVNWAVKNLNHSVDQAIDFYDKMLEKGILNSVDGHATFQNSDKAYYRFQADRSDIAANMVWPWTQEFHKPLQVSADLLAKILGVYKVLLKETEDGKCISI